MSNSNWMRQNGSKQSNILVDKCIGVEKKKEMMTGSKYGGHFIQIKLKLRK